MSALTGKLKEAAGAVLGNDGLAKEGRLEQAEAWARRDAEMKDTVATAEAQEAAGQLARERAVADSAVRGAEATAAVREEQVIREAQIDLVKAEADAEQQRLAEQARIDADARVGLRESALEATRAELNAAQLEREAEVRYAEERARAEAAEAAAAHARKEIS